MSAWLQEAFQSEEFRNIISIDMLQFDFGVKEFEPQAIFWFVLMNKKNTCNVLLHIRFAFMSKKFLWHCNYIL